MIEPSLTFVHVRDLCIFGFHGVLEEEQRLGQRFYLDLTIGLPLVQAVAEDDYHKAVCYGRLCALAEEVVAGPPCRLIETVAHRLARRILAHDPNIQEVRVELRKPGAPMAYAVKEAATSLTLKRCPDFGLSLGSNLGGDHPDGREAVIRAAIEMLARHEGITVSSVSSLYETAPWGVEAQPDFLNLCLMGQTSLRPHALLGVCKMIERDLGRVVGPRWGQRVIDVDILFYGLGEEEERCEGHFLSVPHRHLFDRAFVMVPLLEIAPELRIAGRSLHQALAALPRQAGDIVLYKPGAQKGKANRKK